MARRALPRALRCVTLRFAPSTVYRQVAPFNNRLLARYSRLIPTYDPLLRATSKVRSQPRRIIKCSLSNSCLPFLPPSLSLSLSLFLLRWARKSGEWNGNAISADKRAAIDLIAYLRRRESRGRIMMHGGARN